MVYILENIDTSKDFLHNYLHKYQCEVSAKKFCYKFSGLTLNTKLYKKNKCRNDSLIPGLTLTNSPNARVLERFFSKFLSNFWYTTAIQLSYWVIC